MEQHFLLSGDAEGVIILWEYSLVDAKVVICLFQHSLVSLHWFPQPPIGKNDRNDKLKDVIHFLGKGRGGGRGGMVECTRSHPYLV